MCSTLHEHSQTWYEKDKTPICDRYIEELPKGFTNCKRCGVWFYGKARLCEKCLGIRKRIDEHWARQEA